jgi:hypothetical protein
MSYDKEAYRAWHKAKMADPEWRAKRLEGSRRRAERRRAEIMADPVLREQANEKTRTRRARLGETYREQQRERYRNNPEYRAQTIARAAAARARRFAADKEGELRKYREHRAVKLAEAPGYAEEYYAKARERMRLYREKKKEEKASV